MFRFLITVGIIFIASVYAQKIVGDSCTLQASNSPGQCKLFKDCKHVEDDLVLHQKLPQTCGFQETQPIVCCPKFRQPGDISRTKCREYSAQNVDKKKCGHKIVKRIVGGEPAGNTEFPHMAAIGYQEDSGKMEWICGGSVISEQYILTAAQCFSSNYDVEPNVVLLGVTKLNGTNRRQEIKIVEKILHPEFHRISFYHDIALIKLEKPIEINSYVRPACLYTNSQITATRAFATGWGATDYLQPRTNELHKVTLNIVDRQICNNSFKNTRRLTKGIVDELQVCAGSSLEAKNTCQGDAGGPLQIYHDSDDVVCMYDIVGVTSFGKGCSDSPSVSTRVSYYVKWIEDIVWPENTQ